MDTAMIALTQGRIERDGFYLKKTGERVVREREVLEFLRELQGSESAAKYSAEGAQGFRN
jgi:hypothetical protein